MAVDDAYTKALLHMDGADASTTFTDESGKTWTAYADAQIDTAQSKFGGASGLFDGTGDYISTPAHADFNMQAAGDWTVDFWYRPNATATDDAIVHFKKTGSAQGLHVHKNGTAIVVDNGLAASGISAGNLSTATWYHITVVRESGTIYLYIDGVEVDSEAAQDYGDNDSNCQIAIFNVGADIANLNGWMDEFRVSKGIARWTANFTPPTAPYSGFIPRVTIF